MFFKKKFIKKSFFLLCSLVVGILICEFIVRLVAPQQLAYMDRLEIWEPHEGLGWLRKAHVDTFVNLGEGRVHIKTDASGFRIGDKKSARAEPPEINILMLGDSFLEALQVENERVVNQRLKHKIETQLNISAEVFNAGVSGYNPNHYYLQADKLLRRRNYDLGIVLIYLGNDCVKAEKAFYKPRKQDTHQIRFPRALSLKEFKNAVLKPINNKLEAPSHLYTLLKNRYRSRLMAMGLTDYYFADVFKKDQRDTPRWDVVAGICRKLATLFERHQTPLLFVFIPTSYQVYPQNFEEYSSRFNIPFEDIDLEQPNRLLKERFETLSLSFLDPLPQMRQWAAQGHQLYGDIDKHFNIDGHEALAEFMLPAVKELLDKAVAADP